MTKKKTYNPDEARKQRLAERDARDKRQAKFYKKDAPARPAVKAPPTAQDKLANRLYPNG